MKPGTRDLYQRVLGDRGIGTRHFALDDMAEILETDHEVILARFERWAAELSAASLARALDAAAVEPAAIDFLAATTCTGYLCPGLTSYVDGACRASSRRAPRRSGWHGMRRGAARARAGLPLPGRAP